VPTVELARRSAWSGGLLAMAFLYPALSDAFNVAIPAFFPSAIRDTSQDFAGAILFGMEYPHTLFHAIGDAVVSLVVLAMFATAVVSRPYRSGERWAWRVLVAGGLIGVAVKLWASFTIFMHPLWYGLEQDVQIPLAFLAVGLFASWREGRVSGRVHDVT
jgi:hypothetical protein